MHNPHMPRQCIISTKRLLLGTQPTSDFLFPAIVDRVLVACQIVTAREDGVAGFSRGGVQAGAFVGAEGGVVGVGV